MFSGSRCCLRTRVDHRSPKGDFLLNQELQFLCPQRSRQQKPCLGDATAYCRFSTTKRSYSYTFSETRKEKRSEIVKNRHFRYVPQQPSENTSEAPTDARWSRQVKTKNAAEDGLKAILEERRIRQGLVVRERSPNGQHHRTYLPSPGSTSSLAHQDRKERNQRSAFSANLQWESMLSLLANCTPQRKETEGEEMWLSKRTLLALAGTSSANSWVHHVRGGCEVQVTHTQSSSGTSRHVILRGSTRAVALTRDHFASLERDLTDGRENPLGCGGTAVPYQPHVRIEIRHCGAPVETPADLPIRRVLTAVKRHLMHGNGTPAEQLQRPPVYDVRSFMHNVEDLTTARIPRLVKRELYRNQDEKHHILVARSLCFLFTDPTTARFASTVALNLAFAFLGKHGELFDHTSLLYDQRQHLRLTLQPRTYSYILRTTLFRGEMAMFGRILDDLLSEGHRPDSEVWLALLESGPSLKQKRAIANWMCRRDILGNSLVKGQVAVDILNAELKAMENGVLRADRLVASLDARFGPDWLSRLSLGQALQACADKKAWTLAIRIFKEAQQREVAFGVITVRAILTVMQRRGSLRDSLDILRSHFTKTTGRDDQVLIPIIFMTAWRSRFYNVCRVLWRHAATLGSVTYRMQNVVTQSLLQNQDTSTSHASKEGSSAASQEWRRRAGKVIVGIDLGTTDFQQFFSLIDTGGSSESSNPMLWLGQYATDGCPRQQQSSLAYVMLYRDLSAWKYFAPPSSERLFKLLSAAYAMDVQWKSEGIGLDRGERSTQWMIENALDVPLVRREISLGG
jgi:hypothetical protein